MAISGQRTKIEVTFGYGHTDWNVTEFFLEHLVEQVSEMYGGCTLHSGTGIWREDGNGTAPHIGEVFEEDSVTLTLVSTDCPSDLRRGIKAAARRAYRRTTGSVPMQWVNVETWQVEVDHFDLTANVPAGEHEEESTREHEEENDSLPVDDTEEIEDRGSTITSNWPDHW